MRSNYLLVLSLALVAGVTCGFSQSTLPNLAELKAAAEKGDALAQDRLGESYMSRLNFSSAADWFKKAAEQNNAHAQCRLGQILLDGKPKIANDGVAVLAARDEAVKWLSVAANQGSAEAQIDLGKCYESGKGLKQDYVQAYKWFRIASPKGSVNEVLYLNPLILKMTTQQIEEGERSVRDFKPSHTSKGALPRPQYLSDIVLKSISGQTDHRLVIINNHTFGNGEEATIKAGGRTLKVKCLEIREQSALVSVPGVPEPLEIRLGENVR